jgi:hypothetical protein
MNDETVAQPNPLAAITGRTIGCFVSLISSLMSAGIFDGAIDPQKLAKWLRKAELEAAIADSDGSAALEKMMISSLRKNLFGHDDQRLFALNARSRRFVERKKRLPFGRVRRRVL